MGESTISMIIFNSFYTVSFTGRLPFSSPVLRVSPGGGGHGHHRYGGDAKRQRLGPHGRQLLHHRAGRGGRPTDLWKCAEVCHGIWEILVFFMVDFDGDCWLMADGWWLYGDLMAGFVVILYWFYGDYGWLKWFMDDYSDFMADCSDFLANYGDCGWRFYSDSMADYRDFDSDSGWW